MRQETGFRREGSVSCRITLLSTAKYRTDHVYVIIAFMIILFLMLLLLFYRFMPWFVLSAFFCTICLLFAGFYFAVMILRKHPPV